MGTSTIRTKTTHRANQSNFQAFGSTTVSFYPEDTKLVVQKVQVRNLRHRPQLK